MLRIQALFCCLVLFATAADRSPAQEARGVTRTSFERLPPPAGERVTFRVRTTQVGDQMAQGVEVSMTLHSQAREAGKVVQERDTSLSRKQQRVVAAEEVVDGRAMAATVRYLKSQKAVNGEDAEAEPVAGKTYRCRRNGEELEVLTTSGDLPPFVEYEIVAQNMDSLGKANPLSEFLSGKSLVVGQKVALPVDVATALMGMDESLGKVTRFELTLTEVKQAAGARVAVFNSEIEAADHDRSQMRMLVTGPLEVEVDTCRAVSVALEGPIGMGEARAAEGATQLINASGRLKVAVETRYRDATSQR